MQTQLDGRKSLPRRRRQRRVLPQLSHGRSLVPRPCRIPRHAAPLRLAVRLLPDRLQKLGAGTEGRRLRHGARLCAAALPHHRGGPALPAGPARRRAALRFAFGPQDHRSRRLVHRPDQHGAPGRRIVGRRSGQLPRDDQRPQRLQRLCDQRRALRAGQGGRHVREHREEIPHFGTQSAQVQRPEGQEGPADDPRGGLHRTQEETLGGQRPHPHLPSGRNGLRRGAVVRHPHPSRATRSNRAARYV